MGPGINPTTGNMWSQSDMDICGGRMDNGKYKYYTTIDFPYYLQCYRGETGDTTGGAGSFDGNCGLNNSGCTRTNSSGRKRRSSTGRDPRTLAFCACSLGQTVHESLSQVTLLKIGSILSSN